MILTAIVQEFFKAAIDEMAANSLRCVALAYRLCEKEKIPTDEESFSGWILPEDNLVLLAIVGIKVHIFFSYSMNSSLLLPNDISTQMIINLLVTCLFLPLTLCLISTNEFMPSGSDGNLELCFKD